MHIKQPAAPDNMAVEGDTEFRTLVLTDGTARIIGGLMVWCALAHATAQARRARALWSPTRTSNPRNGLRISLRC